MNPTERFLKYISFDTQSNGASAVTPSTSGQRILAEAIAAELEAMGMDEVSVDNHSYLMATLPANTEKKIPVIGFIAHLDTSPDTPGRNVRPRILTYEGGDIMLSERESIVLSPAVFPELNNYLHQELIVTDGTTLLGADDKAGIAAIVSAMQYLKEHPKITHGKVRIAFTPDEETGRGAALFDVKRFGCEWAYTVDGGQVGVLEYENFNAAEAQIDFRGLNVHPGTAQNKMVNAALLAMEFASWLPSAERPEHTGGYEGFFHLTGMKGEVERASLRYLVRDHDGGLFEKKKELLWTLTERMNRRHPGSATCRIREQYRNMGEIIVSQKHIVDLAFEAMEAAGVKPLVKPIRGGTDGARLSFMGLPCPNIFAGGHNFHGRYEFLPVRSLEKSMQTIIKIVEILATKS